MYKFKDILFVSRGISDDVNALTQAISIARNNKAKLSALLCIPEIPNVPIEHVKKYITLLQDDLQKKIELAKNNSNTVDIQIPLHIITTSRPAIEVIKHIIRHEHDLLVKEPDAPNMTGFQSVDMEILRKCPIPVCLARNISKHRNEMNVTVAIDPESDEENGILLTEKLLQVGEDFAKQTSNKLDIVSCWDYEHEYYLKNNIWINISNDDIALTMSNIQSQHKKKFEEAVKGSNIDSQVVNLIHLKGQPEDVIPTYVTDKKIDILIMGTVARTGIPGFIIGNTAENILQKISCTLIAMKPPGFKSPVSL